MTGLPEELHSIVGHEYCEDDCEVRTAGEELDRMLGQVAALPWAMVAGPAAEEHQHQSFAARDACPECTAAMDSVAAALRTRDVPGVRTIGLAPATGAASDLAALSDEASPDWTLTEDGTIAWMVREGPRGAQIGNFILREDAEFAVAAVAFLRAALAASPAGAHAATASEPRDESGAYRIVSTTSEGRKPDPTPAAALRALAERLRSVR
jgi:hypothetical protein